MPKQAVAHGMFGAQLTPRYSKTLRMYSVSFDAIRSNAEGKEIDMWCVYVKAAELKENVSKYNNYGRQCFIVFLG